tara:strand:- start:196 stop:1068 length:873 start_codon:yes stop_codon:yes gene_type:complete
VSCGLFQQIHLNWTVAGSYDGAKLSLFLDPDQMDWERVVFLDMEILRRNAKSCGNHLLSAFDLHLESQKSELINCANPNLWRGIQTWNSFQQKYPFSTLPLIIAAHMTRDPDYRITDTWISLILQTDSTFTNAAKYQENALAWLSEMGKTEQETAPIGRLCDSLRRLPAIRALKHIDTIQSWAKNSGFGAKQRPCRFDPTVPEQLTKIIHLTDYVIESLECNAHNPIDVAAVYHETFRTELLPSHTKRVLIQGVERINDVRAISLAITSRTDKGLSITHSKHDSICPHFR